MKNFLMQIRWFVPYAFFMGPYLILRILPYKAMKAFAMFAGDVMYLIPSQGKLVRANIRAAMPELSAKEAARIGRESFRNLMWNLMEFVWMQGLPDRIRRCCRMPEELQQTLRTRAAKGERFIYVNPHLGSWEGSGIMSPFFAGVKLVAIAKPQKNPYFNKLLNSSNREKVPGLRIIFSRGAMKAAIRELRDGWSLGTLIDQNTRVRDGGVFVRFFGLPVPSSTAPMVLKDYCDKHDIPCEIVYGNSLRCPDGKVESQCRFLSKPYREYGSDEAVLQEMMNITEEFIRKNPEQYLWFYRRFQYIPPEATPEERARYPFYAIPAPQNFYSKTKKTQDA